MRNLVYSLILLVLYSTKLIGQIGHEVIDADILPPKQITIGNFSIFSFSVDDRNSDREDFVRIRELFYEDEYFPPRNTHLHIEQPQNFVDSIFELFIEQLDYLNIPIEIDTTGTNYISSSFIGFNQRNIFQRTFEHEIKPLIKYTENQNCILFPIISISHKVSYNRWLNEYYFKSDVVIRMYLFHQRKLIYYANGQRSILTDYEPRAGYVLKDFMKLLTKEDWKSLVEELFTGFFTKESKMSRR